MSPQLAVLPARAEPTGSLRPARRKRWIAASALAYLTLAVGCAEEEVEESLATPVVVETVRGYRIVESILATGELEAVEEATLASEVAGQITKTHVEVGDAVSLGQALIEIDREKRSLELANERALVADARESQLEMERETQRIRTLHVRGVAADTRLDEVETQERRAQARLSGARAKLSLAERALRDSSVAAPFAGLIAKRLVSAGDYVTPGQALVELVALDPVKVVFALAERDSGRVALGNSVRVRVAPYPNEEFLARVTAIAPRIDTKTHTLRVQALIENPQGRLKPGLFARADLGVAERENVPMIAEDAVLQRSDGQIVFRLGEGDRVERVPVAIGSIQEARVEIVSGLALGDRVVVRGQDGLTPESKVSVRNTDGSAAGANLVESDEPLGARGG
jgi:membrane fusion protein (multidrug efflux system)